MLATSTTISEYIAVSERLKEVTWTRNILKELGLARPFEPATVHENNSRVLE